MFRKSLCSPWYPKLVGLQEGTLDSHRFSRRASYRERGRIQRGKMQTEIQKQSCTRNSVSVPAPSTRACHFPGCPESMGKSADLHTGMSADTKFYLHTKDKWPQSSWKYHSLLTSCMSTRDNERERWGGETGMRERSETEAEREGYGKSLNTSQAFSLIKLSHLPSSPRTAYLLFMTF